MLETPALIAATSALVPLMIIASWFDLKYLRIPNWLVLCVLTVFIVTGLWGLPLETFLWRLLYGFVFLAFGFAVFTLSNGKVGGGDLKLIAVLVPFIVPVHVPDVLLLLSLLALLGLMVHRLIYTLKRDRLTGWEALDQKTYFPVGLLIGTTTCIYLSDLLFTRLWVA
ncbi:MAG: prepilin peptidase [Pseudomonadota bacterium]